MTQVGIQATCKLLSGILGREPLFIERYAKIMGWIPNVSDTPAEPRRVIIESPYAGNVRRNVAYAQACLLDSLNRGEAPIASHLLYTQVLNDLVPVQRNQGINAGLAWRKQADLGALYVDFGVSEGMNLARKLYDKEGIPYEQRTLPQAVLMCIELYPNVKAPDYQW